MGTSIYICLGGAGINHQAINNLSALFLFPSSIQRTQSHVLLRLLRTMSRITCHHPIQILLR
jgi:hypothetical protein